MQYYGGSGMVYLLEHLFRVVWHEDVNNCTYIRNGERDSLFIYFKKCDKEEPGNYRGTTLLSVVCKIHKYADQYEVCPVVGKTF